MDSVYVGRFDNVEKRHVVLCISDISNIYALHLLQIMLKVALADYDGVAFAYLLKEEEN